MSELAIDIQDEEPWHILFVEDTVPINEIKQGAKNKWGFGEDSWI